MYEGLTTFSFAAWYGRKKSDCLQKASVAILLFHGVESNHCSVAQLRLCYCLRVCLQWEMTSFAFIASNDDAVCLQGELGPQSPGQDI
jgi:hypothetical protein